MDFLGLTGFLFSCLQEVEEKEDGFIFESLNSYRGVVESKIRSLKAELKDLKVFLIINIIYFYFYGLTIETFKRPCSTNAKIRHRYR